MSINQKLKKESLMTVRISHNEIPGLRVRQGNMPVITIVTRPVSQHKEAVEYKYGFSIKNFTDIDIPRRGKTIAYKRYLNNPSNLVVDYAYLYDFVDSLEKVVDIEKAEDINLEELCKLVFITNLTSDLFVVLYDKGKKNPFINTSKKNELLNHCLVTLRENNEQNTLLLRHKLQDLREKYIMKTGGEI